jgi:hypothetical protein
MQKILAGKTTIGSLFLKGSKEDKLANFEKQIASVIPKNKFTFLHKFLKFKLKAEINNLQFLCDIITVILGYIEIDRFKVIC